MNKPSLSKIVEVLEKNSFTVFKKPFSMNLGGIRTKDNEANTYNDFIYMFYYDKESKLQGIVIPGTVDAGLTYRLKPLNKAGTAIIQHNKQYRGVYEYQNPPINNPKLKKEKKPLELGHNGKEAFRQIKDMEYWRDNDKNSYLGKEEYNPKFEELPTEISNSFTNGHDMGYTNVNGNSAGCWGSSPENMDKLYELAKLQIANGIGKTFSFTMLEERLFQ